MSLCRLQKYKRTDFGHQFHTNHKIDISLNDVTLFAVTPLYLQLYVYSKRRRRRSLKFKVISGRAAKHLTQIP